MDVTSSVAVYAAVVSTVTAAWTIYKDIRAGRPRIRLRVSFGRVMQGGGMIPGVNPQVMYAFFNTANIGSRPVAFGPAARIPMPDGRAQVLPMVWPLQIATVEPGYSVDWLFPFEELARFYRDATIERRIWLRLPLLPAIRLPFSSPLRKWEMRDTVGNSYRVKLNRSQLRQLRGQQRAQ